MHTDLSPKPPTQAETKLRDDLAARAFAVLVQIHGEKAAAYAEDIATDSYALADAMMKVKARRT